MNRMHSGEYTLTWEWSKTWPLFHKFGEMCAWKTHKCTRPLNRSNLADTSLRSMHAYTLLYIGAAFLQLVHVQLRAVLAEFREVVRTLWLQKLIREANRGWPPTTNIRAKIDDFQRSSTFVCQQPPNLKFRFNTQINSRTWFSGWFAEPPPVLTLY